jgi:membrane carboxypeptidase/penicillin-binding protein PbpC
MAMTGDGGKAALPAYPAPHPAGSIVSPFLALTAFTQGMSPASLLWDIPATNASAEPNPVQADLHQGLTASYHGPASLREVIVNDYSVAASQVLQQVGIVNVSLTEKQFGISTSIITQSLEGNLDELYSQPITLFENVEAYSVLANQGVMAGQPGIGNNPYRHQNGLSSTGILRVLGVDGQVWLDWTEPASLPVVTPQIAYLTSNVLSDERARWPSLGHPNALEIGRSAAAKVSLTVDANDAWTIGYIPQLAIGVWMGNQQAEVGGITVDMAAGLWHALMKYAASEIPVQDFIAPAGISRVQVCEPSGMLVSPLCPNIIQEVFLEGNEPTQVDDLYQKIYIDRETGLLATIFTPPELVDEAVFLVVPDEASSWARASGLPIPPTAYDSISTATPTSGEVQITKPEIGSKMRGQIRFTGSAGGDDFSYYRLQVGQGLNPQEWLQVGEDVDKPVRDGLLGTWDTKGLDGVYVVELLVVRQDMRIERAIIQITVDNTAPEVIILAPKEGEQFAYQQSEIILMNVSVSDNQGVQRVDYYLDNKAVSTLYEPPFIIPWGAQVGEHTLLIKAYDQAGNQNTTSVSFSVIR